MNDIASMESFRRGLLDALAEHDGVVTKQLNELAGKIRVGFAGLASKSPAAELTGHQRFVRHAALRLWQGGSSARSIEAAYRALYGDAGKDSVKRAISQPATTSVPQWAAELVPFDTIDFLIAGSTPNIYGQLAGRGIVVDPSGAVTLPARMPGAATGAFVAESEPIPVVQLQLIGTTLTPKKAASISTFSSELRAHSTPSIEAVLESQLSYDLGRIIDGVLLSANPATAAAPPGLRAGVAPLAQATGTDPKVNCETDLKNLVRAIVEAGGTRPVVILNPGDALGVGFLQGDFLIPVLQSTNVPPRMAIAVDSASFGTMAGSAEMDGSEQTTLHMDTAPLPLVDAGVVATPARSTFQTATAALRIIVGDIDWTLTAPSMVSWMENVAW